MEYISELQDEMGLLLEVTGSSEVTVRVLPGRRWSAATHFLAADGDSIAEAVAGLRVQVEAQMRQQVSLWHRRQAEVGRSLDRLRETAPR